MIASEEYFAAFDLDDDTQNEKRVRSQIFNESGNSRALNNNAEKDCGNQALVIEII